MEEHCEFCGTALQYVGDLFGSSLFYQCTCPGAAEKFSKQDRRANMREFLKHQLVEMRPPAGPWLGPM